MYCKAKKRWDLDHLIRKLSMIFCLSGSWSVEGQGGQQWEREWKGEVGGP